MASTDACYAFENVNDVSFLSCYLWLFLVLRLFKAHYISFHLNMSNNGNYLLLKNGFPEIK
ncbi:CLUMA_CG008261, isoform A [Clunio marinus]|uniref:CLUMA_CG008261, isoform A n=1 Tax=Clunio marinus TaxID=568069 RepID=A0A1J1I354_9DIPT|nr:CLUMA_CG008261, isoform A [Clunio marinus]